MFRAKLRSSLTIIGLVIAIVAFGLLQTVVDAWFAGYNTKQVAITWIGFDKPKSLGRSETGGTAALPIWIKYMASALRGVPNESMGMPDGISVIKIDPTTGTRADDDESGIVEYFYHENPPPQVESFLPGLFGDENSDNAVTDQAQQVLQPEIILSPSIPNQTGPSQPNRETKPEPTNGQNAAARILNPN